MSTFRFEADTERYKPSKGMMMYLDHYNQAKDEEEREEEKRSQEA